MPDYRAQLTQMHRPRLLIQAARLGLKDYRRDRDLRRLGGAALPYLFDQESRAEQARQAGRADYSVSHHIDLLIALIAETRLLAN